MIRLCGWKGCANVLNFRASTDPDEGHCLLHGTRYVNVPLDIPLLWEKPHSGGRKKVEREERFCMDCGISVSYTAKRCGPCANKALNAGLKKSGKKSDFGKQSIAPRRADVVAAKGGSGL